MTLFETLLSLFLSSLLLAQTAAIYHAIKKNVANIDALQDTLNKNQLLMNIIEHDVALSGYFDCLTLKIDNYLFNPTNLLVNSKTTLAIKNESIQVQYIEPLGRLLSIDSTAHALFFEKNPAVSAGDIIAIVNCYQGELAVVDSVNHDLRSIRLKTALVNHYSDYFLIGKLINKEFYTKNSSLFVKQYNQQAQEMIEGITSIQLIKKYVNDNNPPIFNVNFAIKRGSAYRLPIDKTWHMLLSSKQFFNANHEESL